MTTGSRRCLALNTGHHSGLDFLTISVILDYGGASGFGDIHSGFAGQLFQIGQILVAPRARP